MDSCSMWNLHKGNRWFDFKMSNSAKWACKSLNHPKHKAGQDLLFCKLSESQDKPWVGIVRKGGSVQQQLDHFLEGFLYTCFCQVWSELLHGICIISIGRNVCSPVYRFLLENQKPLWHDRATASIH